MAISTVTVLPRSAKPPVSALSIRYELIVFLNAHDAKKASFIQVQNWFNVLYV